MAQADGSAGTEIIPEVVEEHLATYILSWQQWQAAVRSPDFTARNLARLEERMLAHLDGILVAGAGAVPMLHERLAAEEVGPVLAAAYALLAMDRKETDEKVLAAFAEATGPALDGLRIALCLSQARRILPRMREVLESAPVLTAVAAAEVLASQSELDPSSPRLSRLLADEDVGVRRSAWRVAAILDSTVRQKR